MPKADQVLINSPDMIPAADFSINHKEFTQDCTARIEKMMYLFIHIMPPAAAAPKLQQPKKRRVVNDYDDDEDEDEKMTSTFISSPSAFSSTALAPLCPQDYMTSSEHT